MNLLPWTIYVSFIGAAASLAFGRSSPSVARAIALGTSVLGLLLTLATAAFFTPAPGLQMLVNVDWIPEYGIHYRLAADGISLTLVLLTGIAATTGVLFSWNIEKRTGEFFSLFLALIGGVYGVFLSADAFLLFVFYEIAIVPKYFLIANWGSTRREYAAMKLVLYSFAGSALVLIGLLWAYSSPGVDGFGFNQISAGTYSHTAQVGIFALLFVGFGILAGLFPFHTWAPTGHVAAPTAASMLLAGVVMKLGAYGCLRLAMPLFPVGFDFWQPVIAGLAIAGILYAGLVALVQEDLKFVIGYSSVSHMGFVMLGLAVANPRALAGAVLQMFSHGVIAGLLFAIVGRLIYERTHTRRLTDLRQMPLHRLMPFAAVAFVLSGMASIGMPGFSGFPAELSIIVGTWKQSPLWAIGAALGILIAAAFTLRAIQLSFFGVRRGTAEAVAAAEPLPPITWPERVGIITLLAATIVVGLRPDLLLDWIVPSLESPFMKMALGGGVQ